MLALCTNDKILIISAKKKNCLIEKIAISLRPSFMQTMARQKWSKRASETAPNRTP
jgi:ABC-type uncharacterized transport system auxiliary subunit